MTKHLLSDKSRLLIQVLLTDNHISEKVFENSNDKEKYKICTIQDDGTIIMGKTSYSWWNRLINCQDTLTFDSFALKVWDSLVDLSSGLNNKAILEGLSREIVMNSVREKDFEKTVQMLYDAWAHVAQNSSGYQKASSEEDSGNKPTVVYQNQVPNEITLNINGFRRTIPIIDSVGDKMNVALELGIVGVKPIGSDGY